MDLKQTHTHDLDKLSNKKVSETDKLNILKSISVNNMSDISKLDLIKKLIVLTGKSPKLKIACDTIICDIIADFNNFLLLPLLQSICIGMELGQSTKVQLYTLHLLKDRLLQKTHIRNMISYLINPLSDMCVAMEMECNDLAIDILSDLYVKVDNKDIIDLIPCMLLAMKDPSNIPDAIDKISSTTFVQRIDRETLAIIIPILLKCFNDAPTSIKRQTVVIIENMTKLVDDAYHALSFIEELLPIVEHVKENIPDPEVRNVSERVYKHLCAIRLKGIDEKQVKDSRFEQIASVCKSYNPEFSELDEHMLYNMIDYNQFTSGHLEGMKFLDTEIAAILDLYKQTQPVEECLVSHDAEELCRCEFTLGYGSKVLLHKTILHLHKGYCYGLIGQNNSGKSTLMNSLATQQLESFPKHLRSVYVETDIVGDLSHLSLVDYIFNDKRLHDQNLSRTMIEDSLLSFGFTKEMLPMSVSTLSGGWRMKLALSRAMMQRVDILLMDEPSAHLDVRNIAWLLAYIKGLKDVTCIIVSQNAKLLDECCTHILHIDGLKLHLSKGNLSSFAKTHPEALSYFELKSEKYAFKFPEPRFLPGVKSKGKALMKMDNVTFTYPGNPLPTVKNATVKVSMASRIGCLGPNGAGKSTSIKLLTGQLEPDSGTIWTQAGVKVGYIAQHAFAHIEQHLEKTPNEYIRWRYECDGEDKEDLNKVTQIMSAEDIANLKLEITIDVDDKRVKRTINTLTSGRRVIKKDREYEVSLQGLSADHNIWLSERDLVKRGYQKLLKVIDSKLDAAEGSFRIALTQENVEAHLEHIGLSKEHASFVKIKQLSNGEKVKVVIGAALWSRPHILILDEPTNNIDRDGLSALSEAIKDFGGGIIIITHDEQFCHSICKEIWVIEDCILNIQGDPDWMSNAILETNVEEFMTDALGNVSKVKQEKPKLSRREKIQRKKRRAKKIADGEPLSSSEDED
jgi:elongation factor 3